MTMSETERVQMLKSIGLDPTAETLAQPAKLSHRPSTVDAVLAPPGTDPRLQPVDEITLDVHLLDRFPSLEGDGLKAASDYVFSLYKSYGRNAERNGALHRKITQFITHTRRSRQTGGMVKEEVKTTKPQRDIAALIASQDVNATDLAEALQLLAEKRSQG